MKFTAEVDRTEVTQDDSITLKLSVRVDGSKQVRSPEFTATDFQLLNQFDNTYNEAFYDNGQFQIRSVYQISEILKPLKTGALKISGIHVEVAGRNFTAPDLVVQVSGAGGGTPPPHGYGGGGIGLRGSGKRGNTLSAFVRAEVDKDKVYKGEQIIVTYYLYRRIQIDSIEPTDFPNLNGFLKDELEMPMIGNRLTAEKVVLDGVGYVRSPLVRYAAYPLQEGNLKIDPLRLKYGYVSAQSPMGNDDDPYFQFFRGFGQRQVSSASSEPLTIQVSPLPEAGKPPGFSGGVGEFDVKAAVDKYDVKANEAVSLTVKVEGRGNVSGITQPTVKWPDGVELYDTKGVSKAGKGGIGEKIFEFLLIPRTPGHLQLPSLEFSFFDPVQKAYVTKTTDPFQINVLEPSPGSAVYVPKKPQFDNSTTSIHAPSAELRGLKTGTSPGAFGSISGFPGWRWLYWIATGAFGVFALLVLQDLVRGARNSARARMGSKAKEQSRNFEMLRKLAKSAGQGSAWNDITGAYDLIECQIFDALDRTYAVGARSYPRKELRERLVAENRMTEEVWQRTASLLEFAELVRFATSAGAISESKARSELTRWVVETESLVRMIERSGNSKITQL